MTEASERHRHYAIRPNYAQKAHPFAHFIETNRVNQGMTRRELAKKCNCSPQLLDHIALGTSKLAALLTIERILDVLGYKLKIVPKSLPRPAGGPHQPQSRSVSASRQE
jgi:transcriptional regulator with XRE-family HTH domain